MAVYSYTRAVRKARKKRADKKKANESPINLNKTSVTSKKTKSFKLNTDPIPDYIPTTSRTERTPIYNKDTGEVTIKEDTFPLNFMENQLKRTKTFGYISVKDSIPLDIPKEKAPINVPKSTKEDYTVLQDGSIRINSTGQVLSNEQFIKFKQARRVGITGGLADPAVNQALTPAQEQLYYPQAPEVQKRNIWSSTFRESLVPALVGIGAGAITGAISGSAGGPIGVTGGAVIGSIGGFIKGFYSAYKANQKEEVSVAWQGFRSMKTGVASLPMAVRSGAISPAQAQINLQYVKQQIKFYEDQLRQKELDGKFVADISDYDGKMTYLLEWKQLYYPKIVAEIEMAVGNPAYMPQEIYIPDYEDLE